MRNRDTINSHATACAKEALAQGFNGEAHEAEPFVYGLEDLEETLGREPTDEELNQWLVTWRWTRAAAHELKTETCEDCGREGVRSDWPGGDWRNAKIEGLVLCVDADGHLVCDDCAEAAQ